MSEYHHLNLSDEQHFHNLTIRISQLQSNASDVGICRQNKQSSIYEEECDKSRVDSNEDETLKTIKQTSDIARLAMTLISRCLELAAIYISQKSKYFSGLSSSIAYLRNQEDKHKVPEHLLLEWERNMILIDLYTSNRGLYCSQRIAQDMFDICMETFDWLRSLAYNNK